MNPITHEEISQILLRDDISILSGIRDAVCYSVGNEVLTVKFNHYDHKVIVSSLPHLHIKNVLEVEDKPYIILHPKDKNYFRILKASTQNNQLHLETVTYPHHNTHDSEFEIIVIDDEEGLESQKTTLPKISLSSDSNFIKYKEIAKLIRVNEELYKKNKALEKTNADLSIFVYAASHDLLGPLSRIEAMMGLLEHEMLTPDAKSYVQIIQISFLKFKETVQELAESGKAEAEMLMQTHIIDISELLEEVILSLQEEILSTHASIVIHMGEKEMQFSKKNLRSLLYNLISNAIKFRSPERSSEINVSTEIKGEFLVLSVSDNGMGIEAEQLESIFNLYQRLDQQVEGQGVGLYLVKKIMDASEGRIETKSEYGKGTTFTLFFKQ